LVLVHRGSLRGSFLQSPFSKHILQLPVDFITKHFQEVTDS
jgi:hypothetical protein